MAITIHDIDTYLHNFYRSIALEVTDGNFFDELFESKPNNEVKESSHDLDKFLNSFTVKEEC